ncbi:MAG: hypothetical protein AABW54_02170 [Candidatus Micrarchaeota archaeon]
MNMLKFFLPLVFLAAIAQGAAATLSLQDFSCSGGVINIQVTSAFNCNAVILNDDAQNSATLSSVSLSSLGGWSAATSYSGTFDGNTVTASGTKTITFTGIIGVSPGADKTFTELLINGAGGNAAKLGETKLNIAAVKSVDVTAPSSATASERFDVQATINVGGRLNTTVGIGLSGCSLDAGQTTSTNFGVLQDGSSSTSWKVVEGTSGDCSITVTATGTASPITLSLASSATVTGPIAATATATPRASSLTTAGGGAIGSTSNATPTPTANATATPTPAAEGKITRELNAETKATGEFTPTQSTLTLSYTAPVSGFRGTLSYRLPISYRDYTDGLVTITPAPSEVREGSVIAEWRDVTLGAFEEFSATVTVAKQLEPSVLDGITINAAPAEATPAPKTAEGGAEAAAAATSENAAPQEEETAGLWLIRISALLFVAVLVWLYFEKRKFEKA